MCSLTNLVQSLRDLTASRNKDWEALFLSTRPTWPAWSRFRKDLGSRNCGRRAATPRTSTGRSAKLSPSEGVGSLLTGEWPQQGTSFPSNTPSLPLFDVPMRGLTTIVVAAHGIDVFIAFTCYIFALGFLSASYHVQQRMQRVLHVRTDVAPTFRLFEPILIGPGTIRTSDEFDEWLFPTSLFRSSSKKRTLCDPLRKVEHLLTLHSLTARWWIWGRLRVVNGPTSVS